MPIGITRNVWGHPTEAMSQITTPVSQMQGQFNRDPWDRFQRPAPRPFPGGRPGAEANPMRPLPYPHPNPWDVSPMRPLPYPHPSPEFTPPNNQFPDPRWQGSPYAPNNQFTPY
jgi:hypothetical protein